MKVSKGLHDGLLAIKKTNIIWGNFVNGNGRDNALQSKPEGKKNNYQMVSLICGIQRNYTKGQGKDKTRKLIIWIQGIQQRGEGKGEGVNRGENGRE